MLRPSPVTAARSLLWVLLLGLSLSFVGGCVDAWRRPRKPAGSVLWLGVGSEVPEASDVARLKELGVGEFFVEAARLDFSAAGGPLQPLELPVLPPSTPVTLVVRGTLDGLPVDLETAGAELAAAVGQLRFTVESRGLVPVGFHFDAFGSTPLASYAELLGDVRKELDRRLFLSASFNRQQLGQSELTELASVCDFLVAFLYGQRVNEDEDAAAWDFVHLDENLQQLEELGEPYLLGVIGLGTATHLSSRGTVKARTSEISLQEVLWNRRLKLRPGFSLEGVNRRVYTVVAERPATVGSWQVAPGDTIRVVRAATSDLEELQRLLGAWNLPNHLGELYFWLPKPEEKISLTLDNLENALDPAPASPDLQLEANVQRRTGRGWMFRFSISNRNGEITELSLMDSNYLQVTAKRGAFDSRASVGDFYRYDLYRTQRNGELERTFRDANVIRLHVPLLEGAQRVTSGDIELFLSGEPELELEASFLLPDGRSLRLGPYSWRDGVLDTGDEAQVSSDPDPAG